MRRKTLVASCFAIFPFGTEALAQPVASPPEPLPPGQGPVDVAPPPQPQPQPAPPMTQPAPPGQLQPGYPPPAYGQYPPPSYAQPYPPPPPPPPPVYRSARRHDGFYLRFGFGPGVGEVESKTDNFEVTFGGVGPAYEILLGGTPGAGFVVGGGLLGQDITDPEVTLSVSGSAFASGVAETETLGLVLIGPFADWFFDPKGGAHIGAMLGFGAIGLEGDDNEASSGAGLALWAGYDFWVGDQWSLGPELRFMSVKAKRQVVGATFDDTASSIQLLFSVLHH